MLKAKTKRVLLSLILFFLFLNVLPVAMATSGGADYGPSGDITPVTTTTSESSSSGTGLVQCGNEGQPACTFNDIFTTLGNVINYVLQYIVPFLAILGIVWASITMMTSGGDPGKFAQGRNAIMTIGIGLIIIYLSWTIVKSFIQFLGGQAWTLKFFGQ